MVSDIGKNIASVRRGSVVYNFFNAVIRDTTTIKYYEKSSGGIASGPRYNFSVSNTAGLNYRALHYVRSFSSDSIDSVIRPVLYIPSYGSQLTRYGIPAIPVYEAITPNISKYGDGLCQLSWWSNTSSVLSPDSGNSQHYTYDSSKILKFSLNDLGDAAQKNTNCSKILCSAAIVWENLRQDNGPGSSTYYWDMPVITNIAIVQCISGEGLVTDFSTGGGNGGIGMHSHTNNNDGGLAVATFAPSAMIRPISWS